MAAPSLRLWTAAGNDTVFSARFACRVCGYAIPELAPRIFSFNNPAGAMQTL